jgi:UDP-N-acetylglucosamine:LPS N-acetylglucosamine transferase
MRSTLLPSPQRSAPAAERAHAAPRALRLAIAGGGTGGHVVPGLHLLAAVRAAGGADARPWADLVWFTSGRSVEERVLVRLEELAGLTAVERVPLPLEPEGGGAPSRTALVLRTPRAVTRARRALVRHAPDVLLGLGGFTALPAVLAARSLGIPVALLEINARPGAATRWLARFAERIFHAWPATARGGARDVLTGPPLGPEFTAGPPSRETAAAHRAALGFQPGRPLLVVLGGSQGARALNQFVRTHAPAFVANGVQVLHQTGPGRAAEGLPAFGGYRAVEYVDPAWRALVAATVVLCRGGASTLAELAALRRPAVVVPYPHHVDQHQLRNAEALGAGARIVDEARLGVALRQELVELCGPTAEDQRERMGEALADAVPLDAGLRIRRELEELVAERAPRH